ncbi:DUF2818 family protein [Undibacterium squillarum]|uniref:DUF2818 family protein n=1 Tax=Undibacterium squillarum TaxID=1131567 RepID=UPI0016768DC7|nr:DUF2818 family protein [Undibacterium squillarum]
MNSFGVWILGGLAVILANLPFISERCFAIIAMQRFSFKPFWLRLLELTTLYGVLLFAGFQFESARGNRFPQEWQFFVVTLCLFVVLAFPGFVYRYLMRRHAA